MKRISSIVSVLLLLAGAPSVWAANGPKVTGGGISLLGPSRLPFSLNAMVQKDGSVTGHFELHNPGFGSYLHADVNCLTVIGNIAYIVSTVTQSTNPTAPVGSFVLIAAQDNGEGANATAVDRIGYGDVGTGGADFLAFLCQYVQFFIGPNYPVVDGNIQVQP